MFKLKHIVTLLFCLLYSFSSYAISSLQPVVGATLGYARINGMYPVSIDYTIAPGLPPLGVIDNFREFGWMAGALAGIEWHCNRWVLAGEIEFDHYTSDHSSNFQALDHINVLTWNVSEEFKRSWAGIISIRLGYPMAPRFVPFMRLGLEGSRDKLDSSYESIGAVDYLLVVDTKRWLNRYVAGVGVDVPICLNKPWWVRIEYDAHLPFNNIDSQQAIIDGLLNPSFESGAKPKTQTIKVALLWKP